MIPLPTTTLGPIACVTVATPDVQRLIDAYHLHLGQDLVDQGRLSPAQARLWGRPGLAGRRVATLLPQGDGPTFLRFVESRPPADYRPFCHMGWNAAEFMVQDADACARQLAGSPFAIIGPPADLSFSDKIRALQALGPAGESLYLTAFKERLPDFDTPDARHRIDRVFIVILGAPSAAAANAFYARHFGVATAAVIPAVISVLSDAHGLPGGTLHDLAALPLHGQSFIEADTMPASTRPRLALDGELPPAIAMVSFVVDALPESLEYLSPPVTLPEAPYHGRRAAVCLGAAGEWIELIERGA
jgi:catechol 2,3-dioxygenase-like lactoylglutathione lyase family enzyme